MCVYPGTDLLYGGGGGPEKLGNKLRAVTHITSCFLVLRILGRAPHILLRLRKAGFSKKRQVFSRKVKVGSWNRGGTRR